MNALLEIKSLSSYWRPYPSQRHRKSLIILLRRRIKGVQYAKSDDPRPKKQKFESDHMHTDLCFLLMCSMQNFHKKN